MTTDSTTITRRVLALVWLAAQVFTAALLAGDAALMGLWLLGITPH
jgi:hypothetical protein